MFTMEYKEEVAATLKKMSAHLRGRLLDTMEEQLAHEPTRKTRNRKPIVGLEPPWEQIGIVWELRIGEYRVFYEVDEPANRVIVHAVRHKPPHRKTEDIL